MNNNDPSQKKHSSSMYLVYIFAGIGALAILAIPAYAIYSFVIQAITPPPQAYDTASNDDEIPFIDGTVDQENETPEVTTQGNDELGPYVEVEGTKNYQTPFKEGELQVQWIFGAQKLSTEEKNTLIASLDIKESNQAIREEVLNPKKCQTIKEQSVKPYCNSYIFLSGKVTAPANVAGDDIYIVTQYYEGLGGGHESYRVLHHKATNEFIMIFDTPEVAEQYIHNTYYDFYTVSGIMAYAFPELTAPDKITIPGQDGVLIYARPDIMQRSFVENKSSTNNIGGIYGIEENSIHERLPSSAKVFTDKTYGEVYFIDGTYRIMFSDGSIYLYELWPYFFTSYDDPETKKEFYTPGSNVAITWYNSPQNKNKKFIVGGNIDASGCMAGIEKCTNVVNDKDWFNKNNLIAIGETQKGEKIFELKDKATNSYYKDFFDFGYEGSKTLDEQGQWKNSNDLPKLTDEEKYQQFLDDQVIFFWKDYMGNWRVYLRSDYRTLAECGKPIIYLYPEQDQDVHVQVAPNGGFTKTEPAYGKNGWTVHATPSGKLYNYANKTQYPYLFWEGYAFDYKKPDTGFVLSKQEVQEKMPTILAQLGLNKQETTDFLEFWQPKLEVSPYVLVSFVDQQTFNTYAPLNVTPKPDTIIRVFMDYTSLEKPINVQEPKLITPERNGFTVVEWGGNLIAN